MFLVVPDPAHGLVAAPQSSADLTPLTEAFLAEREFAWNDEVEAYTREAGHAPTDVDDVANALRELGHYVFSCNVPLARR
ncbi:hypothetical protein [Streptomyces parvulus]